jgi:uncharacterized short protein YbdD (DUF466 family)
MKKADSLTPAGRKAYNEYHKKWREAHPDSVNQTIIKFWDKKAKEQADKDSENLKPINK